MTHAPTYIARLYAKRNATLKGSTTHTVNICISTQMPLKSTTALLLEGNRAMQRVFLRPMTLCYLLQVPKGQKTQSYLSTKTRLNVELKVNK